MARFNEDRFYWLEKVTNERGGASVEEIAKVFGLPKRSAATWLCRWQNYYNEFRDIVQHFITRVPGNPPLYKVGPDWWGERFNRGMGEAWHDEHDVEGINSLHVSLGFIKTRTDSITHKRTLKGARSTSIKLKWMEENNGTTSSQFARKFDVTSRSASTQLSAWKKKGMVERVDGIWKITGQHLKEKEVVLTVVGEYDESGRRRVRDEWQTVDREDASGASGISDIQ